MQRPWLLRMLDTGALGVPGSHDSKKGGEGTLNTGKVPSRPYDVVRSAAMKLAKVSMAAFKALPAERRKFWRDAAREAAATEGGESEADGDDNAGDDDEGDNELDGGFE
jgi:hypothetical protein